MLTIDTYLDRSTVHGIGVFAAEDVAKGQVVWRFNPVSDLEFSDEQWRALAAQTCAQSFKHIARYAYKENNRFYVCLDNAQFMNHDAVNHNVTNNKFDNTMTARTDIRKGQELICNYSEYCDEDDGNLMQVPR